MSKKRYFSHSTILKLTLSAIFLAIGIVLPFFTGQIQHIGNLLLPMHLPVFLCGLICGWKYGFLVGFLLPLLRSFMFGMPFFFPNAIAMSVELAVYGLVSGLIYGVLKHRNILSIYVAMLPAMLLGRMAWGIMQIILLGIQHNKFTWQMFIAGAFLNAVPGIILQLVLIPTIISVLHLSGIIRFNENIEDKIRKGSDKYGTI